MHFLSQKSLLRQLKRLLCLRPQWGIICGLFYSKRNEFARNLALRNPQKRDSFLYEMSANSCCCFVFRGGLGAQVFSLFLSGKTATKLQNLYKGKLIF